MRPLPRKTPWILLALLVGGWLIFLLNAIFPVPVETALALVGMAVFFVGMLACVVAVVWAFRTLGCLESRRASGLVAPIATIVIAFVTWSGVIASAVAVKKSMDARQEPHNFGGQTEKMK
jgi:phosphate/sulfate permease